MLPPVALSGVLLSGLCLSWAKDIGSGALCKYAHISCSSSICRGCVAGKESQYPHRYSIGVGVPPFQQSVVTSWQDKLHVRNSLLKYGILVQGTCRTDTALHGNNAVHASIENMFPQCEWRCRKQGCDIQQSSACVAGQTPSHTQNMCAWLPKTVPSQHVLCMVELQCELSITACEHGGRTLDVNGVAQPHVHTCQNLPQQIAAYRCIGLVA